MSQLNGDRFERQRGLVPQERLAELAVTVVGCGAIGRQAALQLAALGVRRLRLVDFDRVEAPNVTTQGYRAAEIGQLKVEALAVDVRAIDPSIALEILPKRWRPRVGLGDAAFVCVDAISTRAAIWRGGGDKVAFWGDGRMRGETLRILAVHDADSRLHYEGTLFPQAEAQEGSCTSRSTLYAAAIAAGLMVGQFVRWLRCTEIARDVTVNLAADELTTL